MRSPGRSTSARVRVELSLRSAVTSAVVAFFAGVEKQAVRDRVHTFTLGSVLDHWATVVATVVDTLNEHTDVGDDYLRDLATRLRSSTVPSDAYESAREVLTEAHTAGWSRRTLGRRMKTALSASEAAAERIARTEATAAYNYGVLRSLPHNSSKRWVAHHDRITRPTHLPADGQTVPVQAAFLVGGFAMMHPGDSRGPAEEVMNCRCVLVEVPSK